MFNFFRRKIREGNKELQIIGKEIPKRLRLWKCPYCTFVDTEYYEMYNHIWSDCGLALNDKIRAKKPTILFSSEIQAYCDWLSSKVRQLRIKHNITQKEMAARTGVTIAIIKEIEHGTHLPSEILRERLAQVLEIDPDELSGPPR